jgi:hypothetical protein
MHSSLRSSLLLVAHRQARWSRKWRISLDLTYPPPYLLTTRCTIGISLPLTLYTTISPTCVSLPRFHKNSRSPLSNAGSMDPDSTTTIGDGESEATESPFQSMKAVERTSAKLRTWAASCRGCMPERPSMVAVVVSMWRVKVVESGSRNRRIAQDMRNMLWYRDPESRVWVSAPWQAPQDVEVMCRGALVVSSDARCPSIRRMVAETCLCNTPPSSTPHQRNRTHFIRTIARSISKQLMRVENERETPRRSRNGVDCDGS